MTNEDFGRWLLARGGDGRKNWERCFEEAVARDEALYRSFAEAADPLPPTSALGGGDGRESRDNGLYEQLAERLGIT
jgi:hypothetical protein